MPTATTPIVQVCIPNTRHDYFDYLTENEIVTPGTRVWVPFGSKKRMGFVIGQSGQLNPALRMKSILENIDVEPIITPDILELCRWIANYYQTPLSEVIPLALPKKIRHGKAIKLKQNSSLNTNQQRTIPLLLNDEQQSAVTIICQHLNQYQCFLLEGVTGSGKTEVYLQTIEKVLENGKQALIIVPEIGLTPQLLSRFTSRFNVATSVLHSNLTDTEREQVWQLAKDGKIKLVIGTRGAIFTPMPDLGLIIVDEEHDPSLKQMDRVRYSARDTALMRAFFKNIPIVLGSATPSLESLYNCIKNKYTLLPLTQKATNQTPLHFQILDIRNQTLSGGLAEPTLALIQEHLKKQHQILIFINRRGFAPVLMCHQCGFMADCRACDAHLTLHRDAKKLICHHCGLIEPVPPQCKHCSGTELIPIGSGTQRIYETLSNHFPETSILRIDRDEANKKDVLNNALEKIKQEEVQLIVGTQMLAKGHHFPKLTLVVIIDTDNGFYNQDFRAIERLGQLITQVAGRAGREEYPGQVLIQTHLPQHPLLNLLVQQGYRKFATTLLSMRQEAQLPPYSFLAVLRAQSKSTSSVLSFLHKLKKHLLQTGVKTLGPAPAPLARKANYYRMQLLIQSPSRKKREMALSNLRQYISANKCDKSIEWTVDIDPIDLS